MTGGLGLFLVLAVGLALFVAAPLLSPEARERERRNEIDSELRELRSRHQMAVAALRDLEEDREADKIGDEDYEQLRGRLTVQAVDLMKRIDEFEASSKKRKRRSPARFPGKRRTS